MNRTRLFQTALTVLFFFYTVPSYANPAIRILDPVSIPEVRKHEKLEVTFLVISGSEPTNPQWPYDPNPPAGIPRGAGISVDALLVDPEGKQHRQPCFYYERFKNEIRENREWVYPSGAFVWKLRFSPDRAGTWKYRISAMDRSGTGESPFQSFFVKPSANKGFIRVSKSDPRYFEFEDGSFFSGLGINTDPYLKAPLLEGGPALKAIALSGINLLRMWISPIFGSAWNPYVGGRNQYGGYLPRTGLIPFYDQKSNQTTLAMRMDYETGGDLGWFDACRLCWFNRPESVKPKTEYQISVKYRGIGIEGPRVKLRNYGLVVKMGGWFPNCYESGTSHVVSGYGNNNSEWGYVKGVWNSGTSNFLPRMYLALENVIRGTVYIHEVSVRERLGAQSYGPEIMTRPSMEQHLYTPQKEAYAFDKVLQLAEQSGLYLKLVVMEKGDEIYYKIGDDGRYLFERDNPEGFYGTHRTVNKTRWLQQAWWRYLQARWGYSPAIHSWELTNEGDPNLVRHYELADEFGKYMHCRVFGIDPGPGDGARCTYIHPNSHLVTTSFWHSFPYRKFWSNAKYPNIDYADLHAYPSTSFAPRAIREAMQWDSALFHTWHSHAFSLLNLGKPIVRGEAGLDSPDRQSETVLGIDRDRAGVWLHNFLWSGLDSGGLYEIYWWTSHIANNEQDHRAEYRLFGSFLSELKLNRGGYRNWGGKVTRPGFRIVGQKNTKLGLMHLWIQNCTHTWKNVVDRRPIPPVSGDVVVPGFRPGAVYVAEWWDTYVDRKKITSAQNIVADHRGVLRLEVRSLLKDVAVMVHEKTAKP